ncbi:MAG: polysaccharide biosynthesis C-terminal domain-containing protein [Clostridia bacterium]|nr:polysaccharide biosynthesis C-terminal domain-containing protein [Clostridia bacterium]
MKENKYKRLFSNTLIFTIGKFVSKLIVIFMLPFYTSYLTSAEYSTADLITNLCNLLIPMACLGVSEGIFRGAAAKNVDKESFFTNGVLLMLIGSAVFLALSPLLNLFDYFTDYIWLIVLYVLASNIHSVCSQYVCAIGKTKLFAGQGVLNTMLTVLLNILFLVGFDMGINGYVLSIVLADFLSTLFLVFTARLYRAFIPKKIDKAVLKDLLRFCLPLIPSTVFWWITGVSDRYMVAYFCSDEKNGLYAAAYKIPTLLTYVVVIFNDAWKLSAVAESDNREECAKFYSGVFKYYIAVMFAGGGILAVGAQIFAKILFAESYFSAWVFIPILSAATVFTALDTFLGSAYFTVKRTGMSFWTSLIGAALNIALNIILIPNEGPFGGAIGASIATYVSYFAVFVIRAITMKRFIPFKMYPVKLILNTLLITAIAASMTAWGSDAKGIIIAAALLLVSIIINGKDIFLGCRDIIASIRRKKGTAVE